LIFSKKINVETIEMITKNIKKEISSSLRVLKIVVLIKISHVISVLYSQKKTEKIKKKRFLGSMSRSKLCENGPEKVEKKNTLLHIVSRT